MKFLRDNWYRIGLVTFVGLAFFGLFFGGELTEIQKLLLASLMALPLHQFEEYAMPGGGPVVINKVFWGEKERYKNYPGNWNSIMIVNLSAYIFYILALIFPDVLWLGISTMFFNLFQVLGHVFEMNLKGRTWYNPGMASSVVLFLPISVVYLVRVAGQASITVWAAAAALLAAILVVSVILPVQLLKRTDSPYEIPEWQLEQFERMYERFHW